MTQKRGLEIRCRLDGIYVHVPLCVSKCPYCSFFSVPVKEGLEERYVKFLKENLSLLDISVSDPPKTMYIGGGTPSLLSPESFERIFSLLFSVFGSSFSEITVEVNPGTARRELLELLRGFGVTRLSVGVQSLSDKTLRFLGRAHTAKDAISALELGLSFGFDVSSDIMFGVPGQSTEKILKDLEFITSLGVSHISLYGLTIEEKTPFYRSDLKVDDDLYADMYVACRKFLEKRGLYPYEISNFSIPGKECKHNQIYWSMGSYLGLGPSAVSFFPEERLRVRVKEGLDEPILMKEVLTPFDMAFERLFLSLRISSGLELSMLSDGAMEEVEALESSGHVERRGDRIVLTEKGALLSNEIAVRLSEFLVCDL